MTEPLDFRLAYVLSLGVSGAILLFSFVISAPVVEAVIASVTGLAVTVVVAWRGLRPWRGSDRGKAVVVGFGVMQLVVVIAVVAAVK